MHVAQLVLKFSFRLLKSTCKNSKKFSELKNQCFWRGMFFNFEKYSRVKLSLQLL